MSPASSSFWDAVDRIREADPAIRREAYGFVVAALGVTVQALPAERLEDPERRHLSGGELLEGVLRLARDEFGRLAPTVFREWGLASGEDLGRVVFQLVACQQLSARPQDSLEDFRGYPDLPGALTEAGDPAHRASGEGSRRPESDPDAAGGA